MATSKRTFRNSVGRLVVPYVNITWGSVNLSFWGPNKEAAWSAVSFDLEIQGSAPKIKLEFRNDVYGYKAYKECTKKRVNAKDDLITVQIGYEGGTSTDLYEFHYSGMSLDSGKSSALAVEGTSITQSEVNSVRSSAMLNAEGKEITLKDLSEEARKKMSSSVKVQYPKSWETKKVKRATVLGTSFSSFLTKLCQENGCTLQILPKGKTMVIRENPVKDLKEKGVKEPPKAGKIDTGGTSSNGFLLGPGLIESVSRNSIFKSASASASISEVPGISDSITPQEKDSKNESKEIIKKTINAAKGKPSGTKPTQKEISASAKKVVGKGGQGSALPPTVPKAPVKDGEKDDKVQAASAMECKASGEFFMVPQLVGLKPGDVIFIPSLKGDYVEDWYVTKVGYQSSGGGVKLSFEGTRFSAETDQHVASDEDIKKFTAKSRGLNSPEKWNKYYWRYN